MRERPSNKGTPKTVSRASNLPKSQSLRVTFSHTAADYIGAAAVSHSVVWPGTSGAFDASVAANSNTGLVLARAGASGSPKPISGFIALIWKNRLNKRSSLAMSLFSTSSSVQMIEGNEVTKLEQKLVFAFFLRGNRNGGNIR